MKVVDASAVAAVLFAEPNAEAVMEQLASGRLAAPLLFSFELANICVVKSRREPQKTDQFLALTGYDASYLWLALSLGAELVTLDAALAKAWAARVKPNDPTPPPA